MELRDGTYAYARGGCDYTGWDCSSALDWHDGASSVEEAIRLAEEDARVVFVEMLAAGQQCSANKLRDW